MSKICQATCKCDSSCCKLSENWR